MSSTARSEALFEHGDLPLPVEIRARPRRAAAAAAARREARAAEADLPAADEPAARRSTGRPSSGEWVEAQIGADAPGRAVRAGRDDPARGRDIALDGTKRPRAACLGWRRRPRLRRPAARIRAAGRNCCCKRRALRPCCRRRRRSRRARRRHAAVGQRRRCGHALGQLLGVGAIRYSWRLILAPPDARRYVVAHEVAHRVHMDHGPQFKALERELFGGDVAAARPIAARSGRG